MKVAFWTFCLCVLVASGTFGTAASPSYASTQPRAVTSNIYFITKASPSPGNEEQQLQIEQLRQETSWRGYLPSGTALVALIAAAWGAFVYFRDQRRDRWLRIEMGVAENLSRILKYGKGEMVFSAQIVSAVSNLKGLVEQSPEKAGLLDRVTKVIATAIVEDVDFNDVRQVRLDVLCLSNWPPYEAYVRSKHDEHGYILYRYFRAILQLREKHGDYITTVSWDSETLKFIHPDNKLMKPEDDFRLLQRLVDGVRCHWPLIDDTAQRAVLVKEFQAATGNPNLTTQILKGL